MQMPTGAIGILTLLIGIYFTNRFKTRWLVILCIVLPPIAGAVALTQVGRNEPGVLIGCYYVIWLYGGIRESATWSRTQEALADQSRRASALHLGQLERRWHHQACCDFRFHVRFPVHRKRE